MFANRNLNDNEFAYISSQINRTKTLLLVTFIILVILVSALAFAFYSELDEYSFILNINFGLLILLLYGLNWYLKGYKNYVIDPRVHKSEGFYKRIYEQHGKNGRYYDTLNGRKIKVPWHWRRYLKAQQERIDYEYISRDGAVAISEGIPAYIISINDILSLDYEIKNGLKKAKPLSFINIVSILLVIPVVLVQSLNPDLKYLKNYKQVTLTKADEVVLNSPNDLATITTPSYIKIKKAWVYQFESPSSYNGDYFVISKQERDRIYNDPSSNINLQFFLPSRAFQKPNKDTFKNNLEKNKLMDMAVFKNLPDSTIKAILNKEYEIRVKTYERKRKAAINIEKSLEALQPKNVFLKLNKDGFNGPNKKPKSIRTGLQNTYNVYGFYTPKNKSLVSYETQERKKEKIKNVLVLYGICAVVVLLFLNVLYKVIRNTLIKKNLVKQQLNVYEGPTRIEK